MRVDYRAQILAAIEALSIGADGGISWYGEHVNTVPVLPDDLFAAAIRSSVSEILYGAFYVHGRPLTEFNEADQPSTLSGSARFVETLVAANAGQGTWTADCPLDTINEQDVVEVFGVRFAAPPEARDQQRPNGTATVQLPGVLVMNSPGYLMFYGDRGPRRLGASRAIRLYWNVTAGGATQLVSAVTAALNQDEIPFQLKVRYTDQPWTERADPAVLYLGHDDLAACWKQLSAIQADLIPVLRPYVPALTRKLTGGLALADDPGGSTSFGIQVCDLIAEGLVRAHQEGQVAPEARLETVVARFVAAGRSLTAPYLNPGADDIELDDIPPPGRVLVAEPFLDSDWLAEADRVAHRIMRQSLWQHRRCTWLEPPPVQSLPTTVQPMEADLYRGLTGVGLLLAELSSRTGDEAQRRHAYGAIWHAVDRVPALGDLGLHVGAAGAGLGVALAARSLDDDRLFRSGCGITRRAAENVLSGDVAPPAFDLLYGMAGAVVALVGIHRLGDAGALDLAVAIGRRLVDGALPADRGRYWIDDPVDGKPGPVGMAHGASGCVWALAELALASGDNSFVSAAEAGRDYELGWFEPEPGNWPDLRDVSADRPNAAHWDRFQWCYGAPGVALARIRLARCTGSAGVLSEAEAALTATRHAASSYPKYRNDVCLCHGAAGLADILALVPAALSRMDDRPSAGNLVTTSLDAYRGEGPWPDGCGLMTGAAGVAYAALRMADPDLVSPLLLIPTE